MLTDGLEWCGLLWCFYQTLILTAPIHCRASIAETLMQWCISTNLMKKQTHPDLWWSRVSTFFDELLNVQYVMVFWPLKMSGLLWQLVDLDDSFEESLSKSWMLMDTKRSFIPGAFSCEVWNSSEERPTEADLKSLMKRLKAFIL